MPNTPVAILDKSVPAEALRRFEKIAPLAAPASFPAVATQFRRQKMLLAAVLARQAGVSVRTIQRWRHVYKIGGLAALAKIARADKGRPRFNRAGADFLLRVALSNPQSGCRRPTAASVHRAYLSEASWRRAHAGRKIAGDFERVKYAAWLDGGRLRQDAIMSPVVYETIRVWLRRIPEVAGFLLRSDPSTPKGANGKGR
jgi:hypothetical protein